MTRALSRMWWLGSYIALIGMFNSIAFAMESAIMPYYTPGAQDYLVTVAGDPYLPTSNGIDLSTAPSTFVALKGPQGLFVTSAGDIYIADTDNDVIRFVNATTGIMSVVAGNGNRMPSNIVPPLQTGIDHPTSVWVGESAAYNGIAYFYVDIANHLVRKVTSGVNSRVITIVGIAKNYCHDTPDNNLPGTSTVLCNPVYVVGDVEGNLYFSELRYQVIYKLTKSTNIATIIAGTGETGYSGNNVAPLQAMFNEPTALWLDEVHGVLYINDRFNYLIRAFNLTGNIVNVAGIPMNCCANESDVYLNDQPTQALKVTLDYPNGVWGDNNGSIYITSTYNYFVQKIDLATGIITNVVGIGSYGYSDNVTPLNATLSSPWAIFYRNNFLYISCYVSNVVQVVYPRIQVPTYAPTPIPGNDFDNSSFDDVQTPLLATLLIATVCAFFASLFVSYRNQVNAKEVRRVKGLFGVAVEMFLCGFSQSSLVILIYICVSNGRTLGAGYFLIFFRSSSMLWSIWIMYRTLSKTREKITKSSARFTKDMMTIALGSDQSVPTNSHNPLQVSNSGSIDSESRTASSMEDTILYMSFSNIYKYKILYFVLGFSMIFNVAYIKYLPWYRSSVTREFKGYPSVFLFLQAEFTALLITFITFITVIIIFYVRIIANKDLTSDFAFTTLLICLISMGFMFMYHLMSVSTALNFLAKQYFAIQKFREESKGESRESNISLNDFQLSNITSVSMLEKKIQGNCDEGIDEDEDDNMITESAKNDEAARDDRVEENL